MALWLDLENNKYGVSQDEKLGAQPVIYLAVSEEVDAVSGKYFVDCKVGRWVDYEGF